MNKHAATFDRYYRDSNDPWGFRSRWYEKRKRALLCAALPAASYRRTWEIGCSNGELAAALAPASERLLATDGNDTAVKTATDRLREFSGVEVRQMWIPEEWPAEKFDLIVLSELAYYLDAASLARFCRQLVPTMLPSGHFLACHWRPPITGCAITGDEAHEFMTLTLPWQKTVHHLEADFRLDVWSVQNQSVAELEGLR